MILLTKLDGTKILLNLETVKYLEAVPDTIVFFVNGESLMVKETLSEVQQLMQTMRLDLLQVSSQDRQVST